MMEAEWRPSKSSGCRILVVAHATCPKCEDFTGPARLSWTDARDDAAKHDLEFHPEWGQGWHAPLPKPEGLL